MYRDDNNVPAPRGESSGAVGIYILPSLFTTGACLRASDAIVQAMNGNSMAAAWPFSSPWCSIRLDGRVARLTHTESHFGTQYDSLADMVSFGLAPALIMYEWALSGMGKLGWLAAFAYAVGAGLRLARFNTQTAKADKRSSRACRVRRLRHW